MKKENQLFLLMLTLKKNTYSQAWPTAKVYQDMGFGATAEYFERLK